jgi:hypothetical protein
VFRVDGDGDDEDDDGTLGGEERLNHTVEVVRQASHASASVASSS